MALPMASTISPTRTEADRPNDAGHSDPAPLCIGALVAQYLLAVGVVGNHGTRLLMTHAHGQLPGGTAPGEKVPQGP